MSVIMIQIFRITCQGHDGDHETIEVTTSSSPLRILGLGGVPLNCSVVLTKKSDTLGFTAPRKYEKQLTTNY